MRARRFPAASSVRIAFASWYLLLFGLWWYGYSPEPCSKWDVPPPSALRKHQEIQENDGQTGSWCLDKAVLACGARYLARSNDGSHG